MLLQALENGELGLWWAPGPAEPLLFNTALVMLEATCGLVTEGAL